MQVREIRGARGTLVRLGLVTLSACWTGGEPSTPAPPPADCGRTDDLPATAIPQMAIAYGESLADTGVRSLLLARLLALPAAARGELVGSDADASPARIDALVVDGTDTLLAALTSDPYSIHATYELAAVYARTGATQCAANLLARLSRLAARDPLGAKPYLDRLFGRHVYLDASFARLRSSDGRPLFEALAAGGVADAPDLPGRPRAPLAHPPRLPAVP
jgi:hypothetical protein